MANCLEQSGSRRCGVIAGGRVWRWPEFWRFFYFVFLFSIFCCWCFVISVSEQTCNSPLTQLNEAAEHRPFTLKKKTS
jgi:hypothetical protein